MGRPRLPLEGKRYGNLLIQRDTGKRHNKSVVWEALCDCGATVEVSGKNLTRNAIYSCGCYRKGNSYDRVRTHGMSGTTELRMLDAARMRAKRDGLPFDITLEDIKIPTLCPVLGIKLEASKSKAAPGSPSIDRIDNTGGYTKDNIKVISYRANRIKVDATLEELLAVVEYVKGEAKNGSGLFG